MPNIFTNQETEFESTVKELIPRIDDKDMQFFLKYHNLRIENIYDFFGSGRQFFALCGFQASGKSKIIQTALSFLSDNVCKIVLDCSLSICLDDILLFVHNRLRVFCEQHNLVIKKANSQDFLQIVRCYLKQIKNPIIIVFNSFENCLNEDNIDCIQFLKFLQDFNNIKVILSARQISETQPPLDELNIEKTISKSLEYDIVDTYLQEQGYKIEPKNLEKFYDISRGYYGYIVMTINILKTFSINIDEFLAEYEFRNEPFDTFLIVKLLSLASDNARHILEFLAITRINFPISEIYSLNLASKDEIDYLLKKNLVCQFENTIYIKDFIRQAILKDTKTYTKYKIHKFLIDFFENQLPLKPKERAMEISRQTMRAEIKYHTNFVKVNSVPTEKDSVSRLPKTVANMSYVSYSKGLKNKFAPTLVDNLENAKFDKSKSVESLDGTIFELDTQEQANILNRPDNKIKENILKNIEQDVEKKLEEENKKNIEKIDNAKDLITIAKKLEKNTDFSQANKFYQQMLENIDDKAQIPVILTKMGKNSQKINDYTNAIDYLEQAYEIYEANKDLKKANKILVNIADLYKDTYKSVKAKNLYFQLLTQETQDVIVNIKCYLGLIDLENNQKNKNVIAEYFKKIFTDLDKINDDIVKSEVYFKYGLFNDDNNKTQDALNFYKKSIETCKDSEANLYLSSCYSNISSIYEEKNQIDLSLKYIKLALEIDKQNNNLEGIYYCHAQFADLLKKNDKKNAKIHYLETIKTAKLLNDDFYVANSLLNYGDFCYSTGNNKQALMQYIQAKQYINKDVSNDNIKKIDSRLNDLKIKLGKDKYLDLIQEIQDNE